MNISDLQQDYPLVYAAAVKNRAESDWNTPNENDLDLAFSWDETSEGQDFWEAIDQGEFGDAENMKPKLFAPLRKCKYSLGPIRLKLNVNQQISNYSADIPKDFIKHGSCDASYCTFEIVGYHGDLYIVKVINQHGDLVTQLGYKEDMLEPLQFEEVLSKSERECWSVRYSSSFTEEMFIAMVKYLTDKHGPYKRSVVKLSWDNFKNDMYGWFWVDSEKDVKFSQDNSRLDNPLLSLLDMLQLINYKKPEKESWCVEYSPKFTKPMFYAMLTYCEKKYGPYKRKDVIVSWDNFVDGRYSCFWVSSNLKGTEYVYSQDNNSQTNLVITLDEMLKIIGYKQGIHVEVIKKQPVQPDFKIRRTLPLRLELKKKEFKQVQIIIKQSNVKVQRVNQ
jgi:hypothetical protein